MKGQELYQEENSMVRERYELALERISLIAGEESVDERFRPYFRSVAEFLVLVGSTLSMAEEGRLSQMTLDELQALNRELYQDIVGDHYEVSFTNPVYACAKLGNRYGKLLAFLAAELRTLIVYAFECRLYELTIYLELLLEIYNYLEEEDEFTYKDIKRSIQDFMSDYCEVFMEAYVGEQLDQQRSFATDIILKSELTDLRYLYLFGEYITENELKTAEFLNSLPEEQLRAMADTYTEGYRRGFIANRLELGKKKYVNIRYRLGFERMIYYAIQNFEKMGLTPIIYRANTSAMNKRQHLKIGYHATSPNRQYDYDHRFDIGMFLNKAFMEKKLLCLKNTLELLKEEAGDYAGPAVVEVYGEELYSPEDKPEAIKLDKSKQKLYVEYYREDNLIKYKYLKYEETSFTIIAYPIPEIGKDFEEIFYETVRVNTLDYLHYQKIQQGMINALDRGEYVRILGRGDNHTDMTVRLYPLTDSDRETIFENCVADVNIPVGEVFTSPVLKGTHGVLHVPRIYLNDLEYRELELTFEDGRIVAYHCCNFAQEEKNINYIKETLLFNQETLPLGEFAIGTNTTAYRMARKYGIAAQLPILIAEKTGPHFAIGDTCYKMSEDTKVYNPDGKEIIARDNEISLIRKTEPEKAYFNCHTDITLPYDEIGEITICGKNIAPIIIMKNAKFVLEGTEALNGPLDQIEREESHAADH